MGQVICCHELTGQMHLLVSLSESSVSEKEQGRQRCRLSESSKHKALFTD